MKKIITIILLLAIIISGFYYLNNQPYQVEDIASIKIVNTNEIVENGEILDQYLPLLNPKESVPNNNQDFSSGFDLVFTMNNDNVLTLTLVHDFKNKNVHFINEDSEVFTLSKEDSLFFFKNESFKGIYKKFDPNFILSNKEMTLEASSDKFQISHTLVDLEIIEYSWDNTKEKKINTIKTPNGLSITTTNSSTELLIYENNELIHTQTDFSKELFVPEYDGEFDYIFKVKSNHQKETHITKTVKYQIIFNRKPVFELSHDAIKQGHFLTITGKYVTLDEIQSIDTLIIEEIDFYENGHEVVAYIPIHARTKPAVYDIKIETENKYEHLYSVKIIDQEFKTQYLYVTPSTMASTSNAAAYAEYNNYFHPVRKISSEKKFYDENFIMPLKARITTEFGEGRYINDAATSYSHSGLDLAAAKGTPVHAINHGVVTLSRHFALTGNTIIIDHGQGLLSYYLHLDTLNVNLDDTVTTGDLLGTVGSTGRSTGPHLHFGTSLYTTYIEPGYLIYGEPITKDNYETLFQ